MKNLRTQKGKQVASLANLGGFEGALTEAKKSWLTWDPRMTSDTVLMVWRKEEEHSEPGFQFGWFTLAFVCSVRSVAELRLEVADFGSSRPFLAENRLAPSARALSLSYLWPGVTLRYSVQVGFLGATSVRMSAGTPVAMRMVQSCCSRPHWNMDFWQLAVAPGELVGDTITRTNWKDTHTHKFDDQWLIVILHHLGDTFIQSKSKYIGDRTSSLLTWSRSN